MKPVFSPVDFDAWADELESSPLNGWAPNLDTKGAIDNAAARQAARVAMLRQAAAQARALAAAPPAPSPETWGIWREGSDGVRRKIRGGYQHIETAGAVRSEIENYTNTHANLLILPEPPAPPSTPPGGQEP